VRHGSHWRSYVRAKPGRGPPRIFGKKRYMAYVGVAQPTSKASRGPYASSVSHDTSVLCLTVIEFCLLER
jgi:hypothetical protein